MTLPLDLPSAPFLAGYEPELTNMRVTLYTFSQKPYQGVLQSINSPLQQIMILSKTGQVDKINYKNIRYFVFDQVLSPPKRPHPLASFSHSVDMPPEYANYKIEFSDGKILSGRTRTFLVCNDVLHLFHKADQLEQVKRMFIPLAGINHYLIGHKLDQVLLQKKVLDQTTLDIALDKQNEFSIQKMKAADVKEDMDHVKHHLTKFTPTTFYKDYSDSLNEEDEIKSAQFDAAWELHIQQKGTRLGEILQEMNLLSDENVYHALAHKFGLPFVKLREFDFDEKCLSYLPFDVVHDYKVVPIMFENGRLFIAISDPTNTEVVDTLRFVVGHNIEIAIATEKDLEWAIDQYYGSLHDDDLLDSVVDNDDKEQFSIRAAEKLGREKPIVGLVQNILIDAIHRDASDIHIRPEKKHIDLIYRIDGTLIKIRSLNIGLLPAMVSRIKIMGRMDISERRLPQDGRAQYTTLGTNVDLRISIMPTVNGESVVIRILNIAVGLKTIDDLGLSESEHAAFINLLHKNNGILLVTGPTGSGKSTTLYAALQEIQKQNVNIITVEDPVEYHMNHIMQIQINPATGYTFARALRNILRHDPDVIMVGEIRDQETAKIAVESALTGHLVLSTLHTNDAAGTISRLLEMEIEPYLLSSSILGVVAQRLVRKNCPNCLVKEDADINLRNILGVAEDEVFYRGVGCESCNNTGYSGRMGVYELLVINDEIRQYVKKDVTADELRKVALKGGMVSLTNNALSAARQRMTSLAEVYRIRLE
jgi:type IV pilus assembly protein PilB